MEVNHHHNQQQQQQQQQQYYLNVNPDDPGVEGGGGAGGGGGGERDRFPQWSHAETKEFLAIRAELDRSFLETKRNRHLWAAVSSRMAAKGLHRTPDQCKCKWKNLVTRYKGCEAVEGVDASRQFPFHDDMRRIFSERMERLLSFDEGKLQGLQTVWELDDDVNEPCGTEEQESGRKKRKVGAGSSTSRAGRDLESTLRGFIRWHVEMEAQRRRAAEAREMERAQREMEWRRVMEALAVERAEMDRRWREREEERRVREEATAERRDALVTALLGKLAQKGL